MRGTGIESSRPLLVRPRIGTLASIGLHAGLIGATVLAQAHLASLPPEDPGPLSAQFLYPLLRPMPKPVQEQVSYIGLNGMQPLDLPVTAIKDDHAKEVATLLPPPTQVAIEEVVVPEPPRTFSEIEVDSAAVRDPESAGPAYPLKLLALKLEGATVVQFVVDSTGHVDVASLVILDSTHPDFTQAVRDVLPRMKYQPARMGRRPVAQLVEQRFGFRIAPP
ncbi:MAG: TonB family protein [Phycisphaerae bacterium]|nr:TonB family protein [Gemmatimonadaceae bacterium]